MNPFYLISKHRGKLMGFSIIWVMAFHSGLSRYLPTNPLKFFFEIGYGGVDLFLFLSGFGLFFSSLRKQSLFTFYWNRFIRILPAFAIAIFCHQLMKQNYSILDYLYAVLTLDFWTDKPTFDWYIPSLLVIYLLFPIYIKPFKRRPLLTFVIASLLSIIIFIIFNKYTPHYSSSIKLLLTRIPIFCMGALAGHLSLNKERKYTKTKYAAYFLVIPGLAMLYFVYFHAPGLHWNGFLWYPFILIVPGLLIFLSTLFENISATNLISRACEFLGKFTLELYLIHMLMFFFRNYAIGPMKLNFIISTVVCLTISIIISFYAYIPNNKLYEKLKR